MNAHDYRILKAIAACVSLTCASAVAVQAARYEPPVTDRKWIDLSARPWKFIGGNTLAGAEAAGFDDAAWADVDIPHTWNTKSNRTAYTNAWYRTRFAGASGDTAGGKRFYLRFGAANANADVYLNGTLVGRHVGGYTAFLFDATAVRRDGENVLAVKVDNATFPGLPSNGNGWVHYGGVTRKVMALSTHQYSIDPTDFASSGVYVSQFAVSEVQASLSVRTMLRNAGAAARTFAVDVVVCDSLDNVVATLRDSVAVPAASKASLVLKGALANPRLWSLGNPYLYRVYAELRVDGSVRDLVAERIGFRSYQLAPTSFTLNGRPELLRGAGLHAEDEAAYAALDSLAIRRQFDVAEGMGMNFIRLVHYPHSPAAYALADERGLAVLAENGLYQNSAAVGSQARDDNTREMVLQNFNRPSILWWAAGNEDYHAPNVSRLAAVIRAADSTRPVVYASSGQNPTGIDHIFQNIYQGWYTGAIKDFPAGHHWISESGAGGVVASHQGYRATTFQVGVFEPEEYESLVLEHKFQYIFDDKPTDVPLYAHWLLFDMSDTKYKGMNTKGMLTSAGMPKDCYWLWKAKARPADPLIRINGKHWYLRTDIRDVKVYSNRPSITLTVNGNPAGAKADGAYIHPSTGGVIRDVFLFDSVLQKGRNLVVASDGAGFADTAVLYFTGTAPAAPADTSEPISDLLSDNAANPAYLVNLPLQDQWPVYYQCDGNADNTFDTIPAALAGARWIATRRQSQTPTGLSFKVRRDAEVYVVMTRQSSAPAWIAAAGLARTAITGKWRDNAMNLVEYEVFGNPVPAGASVQLGGSAVDFVVLVKPSGSSDVRNRAEFAPVPPTLSYLAAGRRIVLPALPGNGLREIAVYSLSGKCVQRFFLGNEVQTLDIGAAAAEGVHVIRVRRASR